MCFFSFREKAVFLFPNKNFPSQKCWLREMKGHWTLTFTILGARGTPWPRIESASTRFFDKNRLLPKPKKKTFRVKSVCLRGMEATFHDFRVAENLEPELRQLSLGFLTKTFIPQTKTIPCQKCLLGGGGTGP